MTTKNNRTSAYQFTVDMSNEKDIELVKEFRKQFYGTGKYVKLQGRWGKNNPNKPKSRRYEGFTPVALASYSDVYVYNR